MRGGKRAGAGRPRTGRLRSVTFGIPAEMHASMEALARARGLTFADACREALAAWVAAEQIDGP